MKSKTSLKSVLVKSTAAALLISNSIMAIPAYAESPTTTTSPTTGISTLPTLPMLEEDTVEIDSGEYLVTFKAGTKHSTVKSLVSKYKGKILTNSTVDYLYSIKLTAANATKLKASNYVTILEKSKTITMQGYSQIEQYAHTKTNVQSAWAKNLKGDGLKIAIVDSGVSAHDDLTIAGGVSTVSYTNSYADDNGHGTHVAGIIGAKDNKVGTTGVASNSELYAVKVLKKDGKGAVMDIIEGIDWAIEKNVDIINVSLGTTVNSVTLKQKIEKAIAKGIIVVAATGNNGNDEMYAPAKYDGVVAVGATTQDNLLASFSNFGQGIKLVAPGESIASTFLNNAYAKGSGTSQATPYVTGMIALYKQAYPTKSSDEILKMVYNNAMDLGDKGYDTKFGYGLVQFPNEAEVVAPTEPTEVPIETINPQVDEREIKISWDQFENATRYRVAMEQKKGTTYDSYRFQRVVTEPKLDLNLLESGKEKQYRINLTPYINGKFVTDKTKRFYVAFLNNGMPLVSDTEWTQELLDAKNAEYYQNIVTYDNMDGLVAPFTFDSKRNRINFENFGNQTFYRMNMYKVTGSLETPFSTSRYTIAKNTTTGSYFSLSPLSKGFEYKLTFTPRTKGLEYLTTQAKSVYVQFNADGTKTFSQVPYENLAPKTNTPPADEVVSTPPTTDSDKVDEVAPTPPITDSDKVDEVAPTTDSNKADEVVSTPPTTDSDKVDEVAPTPPTTDSNKADEVAPTPPTTDSNKADEVAPTPPTTDSNKADEVAPTPPTTTTPETIIEKPVDNIIENIISQPTQTELTDMPTAITYDKNKHIVNWVRVPKATYYKVEMTRKDAAGNYVPYNFTYTLTVMKFDLDILNYGEFKIQIVPRINGNYDYSQAYKVYANTRELESIQGFNF